MNNSKLAFELKSVSRTYTLAGQNVINAVTDFSLKGEIGEFIAFMGPSGCGKSTLLHLLGALDRPTSGEVWVFDNNLASLTERALDDFRRTQVGIVFQFFNLLPTLTVLENVTFRLELGGIPKHEAKERASLILEEVGLSHRTSSFPGMLSGGELQRTAIARALITDPKLLLADEPTGSLDSASGRQVFELLKDINRKRGITIILASHALEVTEYATRIVRIRDGRLESGS